MEGILHTLKYFKDYFLFFFIVLAGVFTKITPAIQKGKKPTFKWFLSEAIVSFFVAFSVYAVFDQFLHFDKMFTYMVCAWCGSKSTLFQSKVEELIAVIFDGLKIFIKTKLS